MNKYVVAGAFLFVAICGIIYWGIRDTRESTDTNPLSTTETVLYWGDGCPHCERIDKLLEEYRIAEKVSFEKREIWNNKANAREMERRAKACGMASGEIGVPFLFAEGQCFVGEPDVTKALFMRAGFWDESMNQPVSLSETTNTNQ